MLVNLPYDRLYQGKNKVEITKENAKELYLLSYCDTNLMYFPWRNKGGIADTKLIDFLMDNFGIEEIIKWNDEFIRSQLQLQYRLFASEITLSSIREVIWPIYIGINTFTNNKETYRKILDFLLEFYGKCGYFMHYFFHDVDPDCRTFGMMFDIYVKKPEKIKGLGCSFNCWNLRSILFYYKDLKYSGLLPTLVKLNFIDLACELIEKILIPIFKHYQEPSKFLEDNDLHYFSSDDNYEEEGQYKLITEFIKHAECREIKKYNYFFHE